MAHASSPSGGSGSGGVLRNAGMSLLSSSSPSTPSGGSAPERRMSNASSKAKEEDVTGLTALDSLERQISGGKPKEKQDAAGVQPVVTKDSSNDASGEGKVVKRASLGKAPVDKKKVLTIDTKLNKMMDSEEQSLNSKALVHLAHPAENDFTPGLVASVWGKQDAKDIFEPFFSDKPMNFDNNGRFADVGHYIGLHSQRGQKPQIPNQDDFFILERKEWLIFGVLDGHGPNGHIISHFVAEHLPKSLLGHVMKASEDWGGSASSTFDEVQMQLQAAHEEMAITSGTTASVVLLTKGESAGAMRLRSAFVGDSAIVYARRPKGSKTWETHPQGATHRPDREDEAGRIHASGGEVIPSPGPKYPSRLSIGAAGGLAMSRSLGDTEAIQFGLINTPEVPPEVLLEEKDEHLVLVCSDGIWDVIEPAAAVQLVGKFAPEDTQKAAEKLAAKAQLRWQEQEAYVGVIDDITVILVRPGFGVAKAAAPNPKKSTDNGAANDAKRGESDDGSASARKAAAEEAAR